MTRIIMISLALLSANAWASIQQTDWELIAKEEGAIVYRKEIEGSDVVAFKGEGSVDSPIAKVVSVILDTGRAQEWVDSLESSRVVRRISPVEYIEYNHIGTPPIIMKDRDFVSRVKLEIDKLKNAMKIVYSPAEDPLAPEDSSKVRGVIMNSAFVLKSADNGAKTEIAAEIHCDPKGGVPKWIVNMFQKSWPINTLKGLREQLAKPDVQVDPAIAALFK